MWMIFVLLVLSQRGCESNPDSTSKLADGYQALESQHYDAALAAADEQLARSPKGPGAAEALYLRGRTLEQRPAANADEARRNLRSAENAYEEALRHNPAAKLQSYIRASLANVQYFQDDYNAALREWSSVYPHLEDPAVKSWVLYRMGLCRQRLGQFEQADKTFAQVQQQFPNTVPAQRAREHQGARSFTVQFATFANAATAQMAMEAFRRDGVLPTAATDRQGRTIVRVGPLQSHQQALALKQRYAARYPDALILP
jgi:tetratricopeptide (TPR) repeat protein